jgi:hypothetical protein
MNLWFLIEEPDGSTWVMKEFGLFNVGYVEQIKSFVRQAGKRVLAVGRPRY